MPIIAYAGEQVVVGTMGVVSKSEPSLLQQTTAARSLSDAISC